MNTVAVNQSAFEAIFQASPIVQLILIALLGLSILCWAIAYIKFRQFKNMRQMNALFNERFVRAQSLEDLYEKLDPSCEGSLSRMFKATYSELRRLISHPNQKISTNVSSNANTNPSFGTQLLGVDNIERTLNRTIDIEISELESKLNLLATTGSTGPFIGLFGTVWGIMGSFQKIGATGNASLAVVAPGISEALVATAIGLAAAIPAVILYNHFLNQVKRQEIEMSNFSVDFLNILRRNYFLTPTDS